MLHCNTSMCSLKLGDPAAVLAGARRATSGAPNIPKAWAAALEALARSADAEDRKTRLLEPGEGHSEFDALAARAHEEAAEAALEAAPQRSSGRMGNFPGGTGDDEEAERSSASNPPFSCCLTNTRWCGFSSSRSC